MSSAADLPPDPYLCRWASCDDCGNTIVVQNHDGKPVPDEAEWEGYTNCPVCGATLWWNADIETIQDQERGHAKRRLPLMLHALSRRAYNGAEDPWQELYDRGASPLLERVAKAVQDDIDAGRNPLEPSLR